MVSPEGRKLRMRKHRLLSWIAVSPDSCIFPHIESTKFLNLVYLVFFN